MLRQSWSHRLIQIFSEGTFDNDVQRLALRREIMGENTDAINTAVVPYVGVVSSKEQEVGRVIESWQGVVLGCTGGGEDKLEGTPFVLRCDRANDGEVGAYEHPEPLLLGLENPRSGGRGVDVWLSQEIC